MRLPYINITTTSYCIEPRKVVPKFWPVAKFGNISESPWLSNFPELRHISEGAAINLFIYDLIRLNLR